MTHEIYFDQENEIIVVKLNSDFMYNEVESVFSSIKSLLEGKRYRQLLIDMNANYKIENRETREAIGNAMTTLGEHQVAFVGFSAATRMITKVLLKTGVIKYNGDFFKTKEEAINWLKSKRK
jgi:hypothetical protein